MNHQEARETFFNLYDKVILTSLFSFTPYAPYSHDPLSWAGDLVTMDLGRGTFKTEYLMARVTKNDLVFVRDESAVRDMKATYHRLYGVPFPCHVFPSTRSFIGMRFFADFLYFDSVPTRQFGRVVCEIIPGLQRELKGVITLG